MCREHMVVIAKCDFADARLAAVNANEAEAVWQHDHAVFAVFDFMKSVSHGSIRCVGVRNGEDINCDLFSDLFAEPLDWALI